MRAGNRRIEMGAGRTANIGSEIRSDGLRKRLIAKARLHRDVVDVGRDVLGKIVENVPYRPQDRASGMQNGLPLRVAGWGNSHLGILVQVNFFPRAPVAIGVVHVAATNQNIDVACAAKLGAAPARKNLGVENIALIRTLVFGSGAENEKLTQVAAGGVQRAIWSLGKSGNLRCAEPSADRKIDRVRRSRKHARGFPCPPATCHASRRPARRRCPRESPDPQRRTIDGNPVNVGASAGSTSGRGKAPRLMVLGVVGTWPPGIAPRDRRSSRSHGDQHRRRRREIAPNPPAFRPRPRHRCFLPDPAPTP